MKFLKPCFLFFVRQSKPVPKCLNDCGQDCCDSGSPDEVLNWRIPFTQIEIRMWNWSKTVYSEYCLDCIIDENFNNERDVYNATLEAAREEVMEEMRYYS